MPTASILISRQSIHPTNQSTWVRAATEAVNWLSSKGYSILTSEGLQTFELLIYLSVHCKTNTTIVIAASDMHHFINRYLWIKSQFDLYTCSAVFIPLIHNSSRDILPNLRDQYIVENADLLLPVSIRNGGGMAKLIDKAHDRGQKIDRRFETTYEQRSSPLKYSLQKDKFNENVKKIDREYVVHWTRTASYTWPGERLQTYYQAVTESDTYPRNAFFTLQNIICSKCIKASSRHMPKNTNTVSFTGHSPSDFSSLMRWRSRYIEMSFEPYGIGIEKNAALLFGIRPVIYLPKSTKDNSSEQWLLHSYGKAGNWPNEDEYRYAGDIDLSIFSPNQLICFCLIPEEKQFIEQNYNIKTVSFL